MWHRFFIGILLVLFIISCAEKKTESVRSGYQPPPRKIALVLDNSGSMKNNDPHKITLFSALIFTDLLEDRDFLYLSRFPGKDVLPTVRIGEQRVTQVTRQWMNTNHDRIRPKDKKQAKRWIKKIPYNSQATIFVEPSLRMISDLTNSDGKPYSAKSLVYFSDGITDRGHNQSDQNNPLAQASHKKEKENLMRLVAPRLKKNNIIFYGIALGANTVTDHFSDLSQLTDGRTVKANTQDDLIDKFAEIFGSILETKVEKVTFPVEEAVSFKVNKYVKELILLFPKVEGKPDFRFVEPRKTWWKICESKNELYTTDLSKSSKNLRKRFVSISDELNPAMRYTIFKIKAPTPGDWKIVLRSYPNTQLRCLAIQNYNVYLEVLGKGRRVGMVGEPNTFTGRLVTESGDVIQDEDFYGEGDFHYEFEVDQQPQRVEADDDYSMLHDYIPEDEAQKDIKISAKNDVWLKREVHINFVAYKTIGLSHNGNMNFGEIIPYTDFFLEQIWGALWGALWRDGRHWKSCPYQVDFQGSRENAVGVKFKIDNQELQDKYDARLLDGHGSESFYIGDDMKQTLYLDVNRSASSNHIANIKVPIATYSGREISGKNYFTVSAKINGLSPFTWKYFIPLELLIYIWMILFFIGKPYFFMQNGFSAKARSYSGRAENVERKGIKHVSLSRVKGSLRRFFPVWLLQAYFSFLINRDYWKNLMTREKKYLKRRKGGGKVLYGLVGIFLPVNFSESVTVHDFTFLKNGGSIYCNKKLRDYMEETGETEVIDAEDYREFSSEGANLFVRYPGRVVNFNYIKNDLEYKVYLKEK